MACRIYRNPDGSINRVLAPNGKPSVLFNEIMTLDHITSSEQALELWAETYTDKYNYLPKDENGEILFRDFLNEYWYGDNPNADNWEDTGDLTLNTWNQGKTWIPPESEKFNKKVKNENEDFQENPYEDFYEDTGDPTLNAWNQRKNWVPPKGEKFEREVKNKDENFRGDPYEDYYEDTGDPILNSWRSNKSWISPEKKELIDKINKEVKKEIEKEEIKLKGEAQEWFRFQKYLKLAKEEGTLDDIMYEQEMQEENREAVESFLKLKKKCIDTSSKLQWKRRCVCLYR